MMHYLIPLEEAVLFCFSFTSKLVLMETSFIDAMHPSGSM